MEFNSTFSDPSRDIYYPSTWGGPTAMEKFDDMKKEFWFVGLVFIGSLIFGVFWWFLVYTFTTFVRFLAKSTVFYLELAHTVKIIQIESPMKSTYSGTIWSDGALSGAFSTDSLSPC